MYFVQLRLAPQNPKTPLIINSVNLILLLNSFFLHFLILFFTPDLYLQVLVGQNELLVVSESYRVLRRFNSDVDVEELFEGVRQKDPETLDFELGAFLKDPDRTL